MPGQYACDDFDEIRKHRDELRKTEGYPRMCPRSSGRLLYDCLRSATQCSVDCPQHQNWVGPNG